MDRAYRDTIQRHRGVFGTGIAAWIVLSVCLFIPEWTRNGKSHCGVFFCCDRNYGNCSVAETGVVSDLIPWAFSSWILSFVSILSALCKCIHVQANNVRQMAVTHLLSGKFDFAWFKLLLHIARLGTLILCGTLQFFVLKFTRVNADLNISGASVMSHLAGWMLFISGCAGYCHGYQYSSGSKIANETFAQSAMLPNYPPQNYRREGTSEPYRNGETPGTSRQNYPDAESGGFGSMQSSGKLTRIRNNFDNIARKFWKDY